MELAAALWQEIRRLDETLNNPDMALAATQYPGVELGRQSLLRLREDLVQQLKDAEEGDDST
jgi:hypothetical protein